jgi:hypothetical protein
MQASKIEPNVSPDEPEITTETGVESQKKTDNRRRLSDSINAKGRKLKLDRRVDQKDRRTETVPEFKGPARRKTIDQRETTKDRRNED